MRRPSAGLAGALVTAALMLPACGGSSEPSSGGGSAAGGGKVGEGKQGGSVTFLAAGDVDYLDPGQTYYTFGYAVLGATNRSLYSFKPGDAEKPVPDLAESDPQISSDNKTITVKIRKGVKYAPPVDREVKAQDRMLRVRCSSATPASVRVTPRLVRTTSAVASSASSFAICCDTADGVYDSASAAAVNVPVRATSWKTRRRARFIAPESKDAPR